MRVLTDLRTRLFITKYSDSDFTNEQLATNLPKFAKANPEAILCIQHIDDKTGIADWQSNVVGPKGGAAIISEPGTQTDSVDVVDEIKKLFAKFGTSLNKLQNDFTKDVSDLNKKLQADILALIKRKGGGNTKPTVTKAGYNSQGVWLEEGQSVK